MNQTTEIIEGKALLLRIIYPRTQFQHGKFAILSAELTEIISGTPGDTNTVVFKGCPYSAYIGKEYYFRAQPVWSEKYGEQYEIISWNECFTEITPEEKLSTLLTYAHSSRQRELLKKVSDPDMVVKMSPEELKRQTGLAIHEARRIVREVYGDQYKERAYRALCTKGVPKNIVDKLIEAYDDNVEQLLADFDESPYVITKVNGFGWVKTDAIARQYGIEWNDPKRVEAFIQHYLNKQSEEGHTYCYPGDIYSAAETSLKSPTGQLFSDADLFRTCIHTLHDKEVLWWDEDHTILALTKLRNMEQQIADELKRLLDAPNVFQASAEASIHQLEAEQGWQFTDEQLQAIRYATDKNVLIITGAAGTGKSSVVSAILKLFPKAEFEQCALSGRAAARLSEVTGVGGKTIHRILKECDDKKVKVVEHCDLCIIDEISMVGAKVFLDLISKLATGTKLIMLGDDGQLESIGMCNIFKDMLDSGVIPVGRLTKIHRQAAKSAIITESMKVRSGIQLCEPRKDLHEIRGELKDLEMDVYVNNNVPLTRTLLMKHYDELLEQGISPYDIQIVVPMRSKGDICVQTLNTILQRRFMEQLSKEKKETSLYELHVGDRVLCVKNHYKTVNSDEELCPIYNGDRGIVKDIQPNGITVTFDLWGDIFVSDDYVNDIELGYALTCHKLQGSEAPYVLIGLDYSAYVLLTREWLYTAITRASKYCVLCAEVGALRYAINTSRIPFKRTFLKQLLQEEFKEEETKCTYVW